MKKFELTFKEVDGKGFGGYFIIVDKSTLLENFNRMVAILRRSIEDEWVKDQTSSE